MKEENAQRKDKKRLVKRQNNRGRDTSPGRKVEEEKRKTVSL